MCKSLVTSYEFSFVGRFVTIAWLFLVLLCVEIKYTKIYMYLLVVAATHTNYCTTTQFVHIILTNFSFFYLTYHTIEWNHLFPLVDFLQHICMLCNRLLKHWILLVSCGFCMMGCRHLFQHCKKKLNKHFKLSYIVHTGIEGIFDI